MADIESMFYQVMVTEEHRCYLKFLWWKDGNYDNPIIDCQMNVHVFGATSSPGCSNYALKRTSIDYKDVYGFQASETLQQNFYVDDLLKSVKSEEQAIKLIEKIKLMCKSGGFNLTKFLSNSKTVLETIPAYDRRKGVDEQQLTNQTLPTEAALGVLWDVENDMFIFRVNLKEKPGTQRGMLSILSSIFDPLGLVSPFVLKGRKILQQLCEQNIKWDEPVDETAAESWEYWKANIQRLCDIKIPRCLRKKGSMKIKHTSLHYFSDASETGYGVVAYIRSVRENGEIFCNIVMAKSRVAPLKFMSVPRLELSAAALAVKIAVQLREELDMEVHDEVFWTDSRVVLGYIQNTKKRFKTFVANRIHQIKSHTDVLQW